MFSSKLDNALHSFSGELTGLGVFKLKSFNSLQVSKFKNQPGVLLQCPVFIQVTLQSCYLPCCSSIYMLLFFVDSFKIACFLFPFILYPDQILCSVHVQIFSFLSILRSLQVSFCILWFQLTISLVIIL